MLLLFQMQFSVPNQLSALKVPWLTLLLARHQQTTAHELSQALAPTSVVQILGDFSRTQIPQNLYAHDVYVYKDKLFTSELYRHRHLFCETSLEHGLSKDLAIHSVNCPLVLHSWSYRSCICSSAITVDCLLLPTSRVCHSTIHYSHTHTKKNHYKGGEALEQVSQRPKLEQSLEHLKFSTNFAFRKTLKWSPSELPLHPQ